METQQINSIYDEVGDRILKSSKLDVLFKLQRFEILSFLNLNGSNNEINHIDNDEVKFLLESSAILACSSIEANKELSYRIIVLLHSQLSSDENVISKLSEILLIRLGNFPALKLLRSRKATDQNNKEVVYYNDNGDRDLPLTIRKKLQLNQYKTK